jgi:transcriptional regulator GlxA family with amidase domain
MRAKRIGFLGFDGLVALDLIGPLEAFANTVIDNGEGGVCPGYQVVVLGLTNTFVADSGVTFKAQRTLQNAPPLDTLVIPGGSGLRDPVTNNKVATWLARRAGRIRRIASVCTGIYALAPTGLLDGRRVTTHWRFAQDLARRFPKLKVDANALFVKDGAIYTSAGVTAGIDLALALIEEDYGPGVALAVARELVVYLKREGGQEQYSEPLQFQTRSTDRFADVAAWMVSHLQQDLSVEALAERACLCPRHFSRQFRKIFGNTPAAFVEDLRLSEARRRLAMRGNRIESVAVSVGFNSADSFRRVFERRFGVSPSSYRRFFGLRPQSSPFKPGEIPAAAGTSRPTVLKEVRVHEN